MAYTLANFALPNVNREAIAKTANLLILPFPRSDGDKLAGFDFLGVTTRITVDGVATGSDIATFITNFLGGTDLVGGVLDGTQDTTANYTGSNSIDVNVLIESISTSVDANDTENVLRYSIKMVMGTGATE